jgi:TRAP-type C4-dicarboxylate transport system permease small subunit
MPAFRWDERLMNMKFFDKIGAVFDRTLDVFSFLVGAIITLIMLAVCLNVIMKFAFNQPIVGVEEVTEQLLLYITFMGTAWLLKKEGHVAVDFVLMRMRPQTRSFFGILSCLIGILICTALTWYGFKVTWVNLRQGAYFSSVLELPKAPVYAIIPIGSALLFIQFIRLTAQHFKKFFSEEGRNSPRGKRKQG